MRWTAIQLGSREHYAVPLALHQAGCLDSLITDAWLTRYNSWLVRPVMPSLASRRDARIPFTLVYSNTLGRLLTDCRLKIQKKRGWVAIQDRNSWFGRWAANKLKATDSQVVFSYSYVAMLPFIEAKKRNMRCILGQIDPGPFEEVLVEELSRDYQHLRLSKYQASPPSAYWRQWNEELSLADTIIVNSQWARTLLLKAGVPDNKVVEIPLVYEPFVSRGPAETFPVVSQRDRHQPTGRLQVLFLGSVILRKGVGQLLQAILMLKAEPIDFIFAGPIGIVVPDEIRHMSNVRFLGSVDSTSANRLYQESDIFLFPTLSDGFGLTQLEALGNGLPVIASTHCGRVVEDGINGLLISEVTPAAIADAIMKLVGNRDLLCQLKSNAYVPDKFHPRHLSTALNALG